MRIMSMIKNVFEKIKILDNAYVTITELPTRIYELQPFV